MQGALVPLRVAAEDVGADDFRYLLNVAIHEILRFVAFVRLARCSLR